MAEEVILKLKAEIGDMKKQLEEVKKGVENIGESAKKTEKETGNLAGGIKKIGVTFKNLAKASGIVFILQKAFEVLTDVFKQNQQAVDLFSTAFEFVSIAMNDFVDFLFGNVGNVVKVFKDFFDNPTKKIKEFGSAIYDGLVVRFNEFLEVLDYVGLAVDLVLQGKFKEAGTVIGQAGKEMVDVVTGVDKSFDEVAEKVVSYTKATYESAKANVQLEKASKVAQARIKGIIEDYDRQAESLRQVRDDETKTFDERIKANEKLAKVLEEQQEKMLELAKIEVARAQAQFDKLENDENEVALIEAKNELMAIEAQITGFQSEQLTNQVALTKELQEVRQELAVEGLSERERELLEVELHYQKLFDLARKAGEDTTNLEKQKARTITKIRQQQLTDDLDATVATLSGISSAFGENTQAFKAIKTVEATISTYTSAIKAYESALAVPIAGPVLAPIAAASAIATGLKTIQQINSVQTPQFAQGGIVRGFGTGTSDSVPARLSKGETVINARSSRMFKPQLSAINEAGGGVAFASGGTLDTSSGGITGGVVKAFVVTDEITESQNSLDKIRQKATI